jgi:thiol-disulfide isomerase/thioredoxin
MTDRRLWCLLLCLLVGAAACKRESAQPAAAPAEPAAPAPAVQKPGPDAAAGEQTAAIPALAVTTVDGKPWSLADHRGRWVVVNFWATWCAPCLKEMPDLSALDAMREHIEVIGLAYEDTTAEDMRAFLKDHPVVYPIALLDVYDPPKDFATPRGLPTTYLIAPDGRVAKHFLGPITAKDIEGAIAAAGGPKAG